MNGVALFGRFFEKEMANFCARVFSYLISFKASSLAKACRSSPLTMVAAGVCWTSVGG